MIATWEEPLSYQSVQWYLKVFGHQLFSTAIALSICK